MIESKSNTPKDTTPHHLALNNPYPGIALRIDRASTLLRLSGALKNIPRSANAPETIKNIPRNFAVLIGSGEKFRIMNVV